MHRSIISPWRPVGLLLAATLILTACSAGSASSAPTSAPASAPPAAASAAVPSSAGGGGASGDAVAIKDFSFEPAELTAKVGQKVTWTNQGAASHTVTFAEGGVALDSGTIVAGATFDHIFDTAGTFAYHCNFHSQMQGTVIVAP